MTLSDALAALKKIKIEPELKVHKIVSSFMEKIYYDIEDENEAGKQSKLDDLKAKTRCKSCGLYEN